jgi:hypothetical protein
VNQVEYGKKFSSWQKFAKEANDPDKKSLIEKEEKTKLDFFFSRDNK